MTNITSFKKKPNISKIEIQIETCILEDGSLWYRVQDIKTGKPWEWYRID